MKNTRRVVVLFSKLNGKRPLYVLEGDDIWLLSDQIDLMNRLGR